MSKSKSEEERERELEGFQLCNPHAFEGLTIAQANGWREGWNACAAAIVEAMREKAHKISNLYGDKTETMVKLSDLTEWVECKDDN